MQKVRLRGYEKSQNSEEYDRLQRIMDPVLDQQVGHDDAFDKSDKDYSRDERLRRVGEGIARKRGCI